MNNRCRFLFLLLFVLFCNSHAVSANKDLIISIPGAQENSRQTLFDDNYRVVIGRRSEGYLTLAVSGSVTRFYISAPKSFTEERIHNDYIKAIDEQGGEIIYRCKGEAECGDIRSIQTITRPAVENVATKNPHLVTAKISKNNKEYFVSVYIHSWDRENNIQLDIIEAGAKPPK